MGQNSSAYGYSSDPCLSPNDSHHFTDSPPPLRDGGVSNLEQDYTSQIPDECLALIFQRLSSGDGKRCSLVCRRWLAVEGQSHHRLSLKASNESAPYLPAILSRFDSVTKLTMRCDRRSASINDAALALIAQRCRNLTRLKLRGCREISDLGMLALAKNCKKLRKFSSGSCMFGAKGMNALLNNCSSLEELTVKRLRGIDNGEPIGTAVAGSNLTSITLKELYNGQSFSPLVTGSKNLKTLKIIRCLGDWDRLLEDMAGRNNCLIEVHLERLQVTDVGLIAVSKCQDLQNFHLVKAPDCSNDGISAIAENCKLLRKLHIDGWRTNRIGDEGLISIAKTSMNLVELVLIGVNPTITSMKAVALNCQKLERLALCGSETIGDAEISCIAANCKALKKLCIKGCHITNHGIEAFATGCPNLMKIKVKKCRGVSSGVLDQLRRRWVAVDLDADEVEPRMREWSTIDGGVEDHVGREGGGDDGPSTSDGGRTSCKARFSLLAGRSLAACAFQRLVNGGGSSNDGL